MLTRLGWFARFAPLLAGVFLCFLILFTPQQPPASGDGVPGGGHTAHFGSLTALEDGVDSEVRNPVNADDLNALLLVLLAAGVGVFVGGWLGSRRILCLLLERRLPSVVPRRTRSFTFTNSLLEVFRL